MKNNKGIALAYTVLTMLLIFAICMLITTIMLAQISYRKAFVNRSETERLYNQIGEIFYNCGGDFYPVTGSKFESDLKAANFNFDTFHHTENKSSDNEIIQVKWDNVRYENNLFHFELNGAENDTEKTEYERSIVIYQMNNSRPLLTVTLKISGDKKELIEWKKGST